MSRNIENIIDTAKLFGHGKITLPSEVRKLLQLQDGDKVLFTRNEREDIIISKRHMPEKRIGKYFVKGEM